MRRAELSHPFQYMFWQKGCVGRGGGRLQPPTQNKNFKNNTYFVGRLDPVN